jgi:serine phosphatase RsbU (regulator of sigma subunit)
MPPLRGVDPAIRFRRESILLALPFVIMAAVGVSGAFIGSDWGLLPLLVVGPTVAAAIGGVGYTLIAGAAAMAECVLLDIMIPRGDNHRPAQVALLAAAAVTVAGVLAVRARQRREGELAQVRVVAEAVQKVVLRPIPRQVGAVSLALHYQSASSGARIGGDLYEVVTTQDCLRLIVGDVRGKGLPAVQSAAAVLGVFREAAHEEHCLAAIVSRIEVSLNRHFDDEQFVTAVLAEVRAGENKMELLSCGHPAPLVLGADAPRFASRDEGTLPLGLGDLTGVPRLPVSIPFGPGDQVLFYTDGVSEARNKAGDFFPLARRAALLAPADPGSLVDRLSAEVTRHVGHAPDDDVALLLAYRRVA